MNLKTLFSPLFLLLFATNIIAQDKNPFQSIGKKGKILTLTNGKYEEFFDQDSIQQIGTTLVNIRQMKVVKLLKDEKEAQRLLDYSSSSRFLSVDPLANNYPWYTPYQFAGNQPISMIDLDGGEPMPPPSTMAALQTGDGSYIPDFTDPKVLEARLKAIGVYMAGALIAADLLLTKGQVTKFVGTVFTIWSAAEVYEHTNRNSNQKDPTIRAENEKNAKGALANILTGEGFGKIVGIFGKAVSLASPKIYNFATKALGEMGEEALARQYGTVKPSGKGSSINTSEGLRKPDGIPIGTKINTARELFESKVGFQELRGSIINQVAKDAELIAQGRVDEITWVFFRSPNTGKIGASDDLLKALKDAGIKTEISGNIPKDIINKYAAKQAGVIK
jgi:hypothetical protein